MCGCKARKWQRQHANPDLSGPVACISTSDRGLAVKVCLFPHEWFSVEASTQGSSLEWGQMLPMFYRQGIRVTYPVTRRGSG